VLPYVEHGRPDALPDGILKIVTVFPLIRPFFARKSDWTFSRKGEETEIHQYNKNPKQQKRMRFTSFPVWLTCTRIATFTTLSKAFTFGNRLQPSHSTKRFNFNTRSLVSSKLHNSFDTMAVTDMERGIGGRIEAAFEAAKAKNEAAFISFITAGYPTPQGRSC
jgi:hypothetical protein